MLLYRFPAVKGIQAKSEYYICMVPLEILPKLFPLDTNDVPPEYRAQRRLNEARIPEIRDYIVNNRSSYVFSALAASVDGYMKFQQTGDSNIGFLEIDMKAHFMINDGQHRRAAIEAALEEDESLGEETISIVIYQDQGLQRSQQMFSDLNKHAVITSKSLNTLYDAEDEIALISRKVVDEIPFFHKYTDKEKDNLGKFSSNLFTLNSFYNANQKLLRGITGDFDTKYNFVLKFWNCIASNMKQWNELESGEITKRDLRENYIATQGITLIAMARLGNFLYNNKKIDMEKTLKGIAKIDWLRNNTKDWLGRAIKSNGQINRNEQGVFATYVQIKRLLNLPVSAEEKQRESV